MSFVDAIIDSLGGNKFVCMVDAKDMVYSDSDQFLMFKIARNDHKVTHVKVTLTALDLYDVEYLNIRARKVKVISKSSGLLGNQLAENFERNTGLKTKLF